MNKHSIILFFVSIFLILLSAGLIVLSNINWNKSINIYLQDNATDSIYFLFDQEVTFTVYTLKYEQETFTKVLRSSYDVKAREGIHLYQTYSETIPNTLVSISFSKDEITDYVISYNGKTGNYNISKLKESGKNSFKTQDIDLSTSILANPHYIVK